MPSFVIEASKLVKYYSKKGEPALDDINLSIKEGQIFTLLGRNGAGKTTFLRIATTPLARRNRTDNTFISLDSRRDRHTGAAQSNYA